ncbi:hypothetical protein COT20_00660 [bacterium (Candidatus Gribaldobacteria) CG08_land_8_20_14_0_20_39_15]|uniref:Type 4 fimbrial biogenesis protein PilX N-terminal domain-containing protein n=1 Tax=bacterium (Candidatus Gribaldobacteria) CG08_land_8_20_14_0_20_39_15 TaxID=2014273 RepID=A0A2M6XV04_9BACT|nr:MAG: hypothetical protein COT20_00660 [bacterium (Candidatus Gribaldobacteria) CG08_land_8_20_14_0_20_39_15]
MNKIFLNQNKPGSILIIAILVLSVMSFLATYLLSFTLIGSKMTKSYELNTNAYYLSEAGLSEAVFKLKNDSVWKNAFETMPTIEDPDCSSWSITPFVRSAVLGTNNNYEIIVANLGCAKAEITITARINSSNSLSARKIIKTQAFKAIGSPVIQHAIFTSGASENMEISATNPLRVHNGALFSNNILKVKNGSVVQVDDKALAVGNILLSSGGQIEGTACSSNLCDANCAASTECPPQAIASPPLDFDSTSTASYFWQAQNSDCASVRQDGKTDCLFTSEEFEEMLWHNPELSLPVNAVVYVSGDINVKADQKLTINGVLAANRDINLGLLPYWSRSEPPYDRYGFSQVIVARPDDNLPSGLLAKRKITTSSWLGREGSALNVHGLMYSGDETKLSSAAAAIVITGGIAARKLTISSLWNGLDIYLDLDVIADTFGNSQYSPTVTVDHWEEEY